MIENERKEKEKEFKQQFIIEAAKKLFNEQGFENTTMADIATAAGFAKGTLYLYFETKEDLMLAVRGEVFNLFLDEIQKVIDKSVSAEIKMAEIRILYLNFHFDKVHKLGVIAIVGKCNFLNKLAGNQEFRQAVQNHRLRLVKSLAEIIIQGQLEKVFKKELDPDLTAILIDALFMGTMKNILFDKDYLDSMNYTSEMLINSSFDFFLASIKI